jgi:hypothetical protein
MQISQPSTSSTIVKKKPRNDGGCPQKKCGSVMRYLIEILGFLVNNMFVVLLYTVIYINNNYNNKLPQYQNVFRPL